MRPLNGLDGTSNNFKCALPSRISVFGSHVARDAAVGRNTCVGEASFVTRALFTLCHVTGHNGTGERRVDNEFGSAISGMG